mmetsp:Transcript_7406/g.19983  ORF Transcript_7406/g.19983 Transcript_7406/m.19983 type:complete len:202 (-) Transcript_7406:1568-2173(-)
MRGSEGLPGDVPAPEHGQGRRRGRPSDGGRLRGQHAGDPAPAGHVLAEQHGPVQHDLRHGTNPRCHHWQRSLRPHERQVRPQDLGGSLRRRDVPALLGAPGLRPDRKRALLEQRGAGDQRLRHQHQRHAGADQRRDAGRDSRAGLRTLLQHLQRHAVWAPGHPEPDEARLHHRALLPGGHLRTLLRARGDDQAGDEYPGRG